MNARSLGFWLSCLLPVLRGSEALGQDSPAPPPEVEVCHPITRAVSDYEEFVGRIEAGAVVEVRPLVSGPLEKVTFQDGAKVGKGDLLFEIDPRPFQADLEKADAEVKRCEARLSHAARILAARKPLHDKNSITEQAWDEAVADHDDAEAVVLIARAARDRARLNLDSTRIQAPIDGQIGRALLNPGNLVEAGTTPLATIVSVDRVFASFDVDERTLLRLRKAMRNGEIKIKGESELKVLMGLADGEGFPYRGKVDFVDIRVHPDKGTIPMRAVFPNADQALMPGMFARVRLVTSDSRDVMLIPEEVGYRDGAEDYVYVMTEKNAIEVRTVKFGSHYDGLVGVREGLKAADWVVLGLHGQGPGKTIKPKQVDMPIPPSFSQNQPEPDEHPAPDRKQPGGK